MTPQLPMPAPAGPAERSRDVLAGLRVSVLGADASPHVTGFAGHRTATADLITAHGGVLVPGPEAAGGSRPDVVLALAPGQGSAAAAEVAERADLPLLVLTQGSTIPARASGGAVGETLAARLDRALARRADRWAVTGSAAHQHLVLGAVPAARIDRVPYWWPSPPLPDRPEARRRLGWPASSPFLVVCPVGAAVGAVGGLLETVEVLQARQAPVRLVVSGRGGKLRQLRDAAGPGARAVVEVASEEYPLAFAAADLVLLTSADDPRRADAALAGRVATALAAGRAMAYVDGGAPLPADVAAVERACVRLRADRADQLADALHLLADSTELTAQLAAEARHYAQDRLKPHAAADALGASLAATIRQRRR